MEFYTLIWVRDQRSRPIQISIPKRRVQRAAIAAGLVVVLSLVLAWDYWRLRADNVELADLRIEALGQREKIAVFQSRLAQVDEQINKVTDLERKVRIIANLPGTAGIGGDDVTELAPEAVGPPVGVPVDRPQPPGGQTGQGGDEPPSLLGDDESGIDVLEFLGTRAVDLVGGAGQRADSLEILLEQLADKRQRLVSMPSIWPAKGWLTSRFGPRVSPFTGRRQVHGGIDIAAASGTSVYAPARGRVVFAGRKGPLGKALVLDHGFGVKTVYGHAKEIHVDTGETVERGQEIASIGSTGRSTGPHLHYVVEVSGKARNPLDYIFD
ncbi:MAG: M23 family metallopeptidase [bacterium]|nr:M23 family metallopeptidase [bacterium]